MVRLNISLQSALWAATLIFIGSALYAIFYFTPTHTFVENYRVFKHTSYRATVFYFVSLALMGIGVVSPNFIPSKIFLTQPFSGYKCNFQSIYAITTLVILACIVGHLSLFWLGRSLFFSAGGIIAEKKMLNLTGTRSPVPFIYLLPLAAGLAAHIHILRPRNVKIRFFYAIAFALAALVSIRTFFFERLPALELILPVAFILYSSLTRRQKNWVIVIVCSAVPLIFCIAEYFRSWPEYIAEGKVDATVLGFLGFMLYRMLGYYLVPISYLGVIVDANYGGHTEGYYTLRAFTNTPVVGTLVRVLFGMKGFTEKHATEFLDIIVQNDLNPEFNLFGAMGYLYLDFGWNALLATWAIGFLVGSILKLRQNNRTIGVGLLPVVVVGVFELPRLLYFTHERIFPSAVAAVLIACFFPIFYVPSVSQRDAQ